MTERENQVVELFKAGNNPTSIYKITGCTHKSIYRILAKYDIEFPIKDEVLNLKDQIIKLHVEDKLSVDNIAKKLNIAQTEVHKLLHKFKAMIPPGKNTKYTCDYKFFDNIDSEQKAYWLGVLYADGNIQQNRNSWSVIISSIDKDWLSKFYEHTHATHVLNREFHKKFLKEIWKVRITNEHMAKSLIKLGCVPTKSMIIEMPQIQDEYIRHFIRGYFDGDGWVSISSNSSKFNWKTLRSGICSGSKKFLEQIAEYIPVKNKTVKKDKRKELYRLEWSVNDSKDFYKFIYKNSTIFLERKKIKFENYKQRRSETIIDNPLDI